MSSDATSSPPQCQVILVLAHLLQQRSLSYDDEKNALLDASVKCGLSMTTQHNNTQLPDVGAMDIDGEPRQQDMREGEVHIVLTGSPRPTFAETNAWLLEGTKDPSTPQRKSKGPAGGNGENSNDAPDATPGSFRGSYSILDNVASFHEDDENDSDASMEDANDNERGPSGAQLLAEYVSECTHNSTTSNANMDELPGSPTRTGESVLQEFQERKYSHGNASAGQSEGGAAATVMEVPIKNGEESSDSKYKRSVSNGSTGSGPMVGQAVVNAVSQKSGAGLRSSRSRLLQGTIDRPLWDQRRWTDGECLFSDLVDRCGLESFENVGIAGSHIATPQNSGADAAAGGSCSSETNMGVAGLRLRKTSNLGAHLITVPATILSQTGGIGNALEEGAMLPGLEEDIVDEIARGILRCLKRKKSPPASKVYLVLPPKPSGGSHSKFKKEMVSAQFSAAWQKLEQYNDMIGAPRLMADAQFEFVDISV